MPTFLRRLKESRNRRAREEEAMQLGRECPHLLCLKHGFFGQHKRESPNVPTFLFIGHWSFCARQLCDCQMMHKFMSISLKQLKNRCGKMSSCRRTQRKNEKQAMLLHSLALIFHTFHPATAAEAPV